MQLTNYGIHVVVGDAGFRPGSRATFVSAKVAKTSDAQTGFIGWDRREPSESRPTRCAQTRSAECPERLSLEPVSRR